MLQQTKTCWTMLCVRFCDRTFWEGYFVFLHDCSPVHKTRTMKTWFDELSLDERVPPAHNPDLNPTESIWDKLEWRLQARPSHPTSMSDLIKALQIE